MGKKKKENANNEPLTTQQLYDVFKFAQNVYNTARSNQDYLGVFTPNLTNERLSEIGLDPQNVSSEKTLDLWTRDPVSNQLELKSYSEYLMLVDMAAQRTKDYLGNLPAFDYTFTCTNIKDASEYESEEYKDDLRIVKDFLSKFDVRGQFSYVTRRTFESDSFYAVFRRDGQHFQFQELPAKYCKITGKNLDWGYQFDFDMSWFLKMGLSFDQYPPIFKNMYDRVMSAKLGTKYNPANPLDKRYGTFALWSQTSSLPNRGNFVCFKRNSDKYAEIPYLTPLFQDAINKPLIRQLSMNQSIISAYKIMVGLIPMLDGQKSGAVKDALAVSPETMGKFLGLLKRGIPEAVKISGVPFKDVKQVDFTAPVKNMYDTYNTIEAANSGATSSLIYSSEGKTATEMEYSVGVDSMIATSIYPQLETWLSSEINYFTHKYKFKFKFEGTKFYQDRERRKKAAIEFANMGLFNEQKIAAAWGMDVFDLKAQLEMGKSSGIFDLLRLPPNANTASLGTEDAGRPTSEVPSDSRERDANRLVGG